MLGEFKLGTGDELKQIRTARDRAASICNAFAIVTYSSIFFLSFFSNPLFSAVAQRTPVKSIREVRS